MDSELSDPATLWKVSGDSNVTKIGTVPIIGACNQPALRSLHGMAKGRLSAMADCPTTNTHYFVAIDISEDSASASVLATLPSQHYDGIWKENLDAGWISYSNDDCAAIGVISGSGITGLGEVIPHAAFGWPIDAHLIPATNSDCTDDGEASFVSIGELSDTLYFMASSEATGKLPFQRYNLQWSVYAMDLTNRRVADIAGGFSVIYDADSSADGTQYVIAGKHNGVDGIWRVMPSTADIEKLSDGLYGNVRFSSNDDVIAVSYDTANFSIVRLSASVHHG
jgi:hypothetical protein